jgi:hypothetical protein
MRAGLLGGVQCDTGQCTVTAQIRGQRQQRRRFRSLWCGSGTHESEPEALGGDRA